MDNRRRRRQWKTNRWRQGRKRRRWTWGPSNSSTRRQSSSRHVTARNLPLSRGGCCATRRVVKVCHGTAAAAAAAAIRLIRTVGVADPRREGVRFSAVEFCKWYSSCPNRRSSPLHFQCRRDLIQKINDCILTF